MKTMTIDGVEYAEAREENPGNCTGCEFLHDSGKCHRSSELARTAFGDDCVSRKKIYIRVKRNSSAAMDELLKARDAINAAIAALEAAK
jgi:hypothetical protein